MEAQGKKSNWNAWSQQDDAKLRELAEGGVAYSEIAAIIGRGRNSCIGRAHRLGIISTWTKPAKSDTPNAVKQRARPIEKLFVEKPKPAPAQDNRPQPASQSRSAPPRYAPPEASTTPFGVPRKLMELQPHHCRWPVSGERTETLFCCADRESLTSPYCTDHRLLAWRPTTRQLTTKAYR